MAAITATVIVPPTIPLCTPRTRSYGYGGPVAYPQVNYYPGSYAPYPVYYGGGHRHHRHHHHHRHHDHHGHGGLRVSFGF